MSLSRRRFASGLALIPLTGAKSETSQQPVGTNKPTQFDIGAWRLQVFDDHQLETVAVLSETIIPKTDTPGAREVLVAQHLDHILAAAAEAERINFLEGLWWLDGYCQRTRTKPFKDLSFAEQTELVARLNESAEPELQLGKNFVHLAKVWTARIYYATEIGVQELNKGGRAPAHYESDCAR